VAVADLVNALRLLQRGICHDHHLLAGKAAAPAEKGDDQVVRHLATVWTDSAKKWKDAVHTTACQAKIPLHTSLDLAVAEMLVS
jgi:hypothetical protein